MERAALISVSNKSGLVEFARGLQDAGLVLLGTKGTKSYLEGEGLEVVSIEEYTGQNEILDGRVKTLHPRIHAGLLADRGKPEHLRELETAGMYSIEVAVVNLYPFIQNLESEKASNPLEMIELIDIGGPTMIRAAAKNFRHVFPVIDPADYSNVLHALGQDSASSFDLRRSLAVKVFRDLALYNLEIARYFSEVELQPEALRIPEHPAGPERIRSKVTGIVLERAQELRYGENPHQNAGYYRDVSLTDGCWKQHQGKELSYNNLLDFDAAARIVRSFDPEMPAVAILKHLNPCGAAIGANTVGALARARQGDPRSHFGGVIACNTEITEEDALAIIEDFTEIVVAPSYTSAALEVFARRKNVRVVSLEQVPQALPEIRSVVGGYLVQQPDQTQSTVADMRIVSRVKPTSQQILDLDLAWKLCAHVKSNAITIVKDGMLLASGAGQMSRIDSVEVALQKIQVHGHNIEGAVCASDAFFPFSDCLETLAEAGVRAVVAPEGARRDDEIIDAADVLGIALAFAPDRHFRH